MRFLPALALWGAGAIYQSVRLDAHGQLYIVAAGGAEIVAPKLPGQTAFEDPELTPGGRTAGWLALYPDPIAGNRGDPLAGDLVLFRDGRILHHFSTNQVFWDWQFQENGKRVVYSTGPTHGGAAECIQRDVETGKITARWTVTQDGEPPFWAVGLRR